MSVTCLRVAPPIVGLPARCHLDQVDEGGLVDGAGGEPALVGRLVDDHGVLHVVAGVADDRDDGVGSHRVVVHADVVVVRGAEEGRRRRLMQSEVNKIISK